jgi:myosin heavy subunit
VYYLSGNLEFEKKGDEGSTIKSANDCRKIASLLGLQDSAEILENFLCFRENLVSAGGKVEIYNIPLTPTKAMEQRDALAKYIYGRLFDIIVKKVNESLYRGKFGRNIGVLDIFGFEVFQFNSFEQLCINYCNERLQTFFNEIIFEGEMRMYAADGVNCEDITYQVSSNNFLQSILIRCVH